MLWIKDSSVLRAVLYLLTVLTEQDKRKWVWLIKNIEILIGQMWKHAVNLSKSDQLWNKQLLYSEVKNVLFVTHASTLYTILYNA